jgi:hypothetical protein
VYYSAEMPCTLAKLFGTGNESRCFVPSIVCLVQSIDMLSHKKLFMYLLRQYNPKSAQNFANIRKKNLAHTPKWQPLAIPLPPQLCKKWLYSIVCDFLKNCSLL